MNYFDVGDTVKCRYEKQYYDYDLVSNPLGKIGIVLEELPHSNKFCCLYLVRFEDLLNEDGTNYIKSFSPDWLELVNKVKRRVIKIV